MFPDNLKAIASELFKSLKSKKMRLATAESCTGGLISTVITDIPGASSIFERGFVTYSNESKIELLTVPTFYIEDFGAVSMEVAVAMAEGALLMSKADISVSVTGVAGPDGGTEEKPVGTVFIGCAVKNSETVFEKFCFSGSREKIRLQSTEAAMRLALRCLSK